MKLKLSLSRSLRSRSKRSSGRNETNAPEPSVDCRSPLVKELSATFVVFDRDADGKISKSELGTVLSALGDDLSELELDELMAKVDGDGDGFIDLQEFIDFHTDKSGRFSDASLSSESSSGRCGVDWSDEEHALRAAFDVFDNNKDGFISAEELRRVMCNLGDKHISLAECSHMISCVDKDGNQMMLRGMATALKKTAISSDRAKFQRGRRGLPNADCEDRPPKKDHIQRGRDFSLQIKGSSMSCRTCLAANDERLVQEQQHSCKHCIFLGPIMNGHMATEHSCRSQDDDAKSWNLYMGTVLLYSASLQILFHGEIFYTVPQPLFPYSKLIEKAAV